MAELQVGDVAPDFSLLDDAGSLVRLQDFRGKSLVIFFYPEDDTPGCTQQACGFRDDFAAFRKLETAVVGMSPDGVASHAAFKKKFSLPFPLLSDPEKNVITAYGAWGEKSMYGQKSIGLIRSSIIVTPEGRIGGIFRNVRTEGNAHRMLAALEKLG